MKIAMHDVQDLLQEGRIFVGHGTKSLAQTGHGFPPSTMMNIQPGIEIEPYTTFWAKAGLSLVSMGAFSYTHSVLSGLITVGRYTSIAKGLRVLGSSHPTNWVSTSPVFYNHKTMMAVYQADRGAQLQAAHYVPSRERIRIGHDVWIGENVTIAKGVTIGNGSIVASNATVTKDVAPYSVVGGLPATLIKYRFSDRVIDLLKESEWWQYDPQVFSDLDPQDPERFADSLIDSANARKISPYRPTPLKYSDFQSAAG